MEPERPPSLLRVVDVSQRCTHGGGGRRDGSRGHPDDVSRLSTQSQVRGRRGGSAFLPSPMNAEASVSVAGLRRDSATFVDFGNTSVRGGVCGLGTAAAERTNDRGATTKQCELSSQQDSSSESAEAG